MKKNLTLLTLLLTVIFAANAQTVSVVTIDSARANNAQGVPYINGSYVQLTGTVYGPNQYPTHNGNVFILNDGSAGIKVYSKHTYGYAVTNGDSIVVVGVLNNFDGEEELDLFDSVAVDTIYKVGTGNYLSPVVVTTIGESNVSQLIEIQNVDMTSATGWLDGVTGYHDFDAIAGGYSIYIDSFMNNAMYNTPQPQGIYDIIGFGEQFDETAPYTSGFEIGPRSMADFIQISTGINDVNTALQARIYPNPGNGNFYIYLNDNNVTEADLNVLDISGRVVYAVHQSTDGGRFTLNAQNLSAGIYEVEVRNGAEIFRNKIVVTK